jgi:glycosyltransferase involved in cell wall biosynthesis
MRVTVSVGGRFHAFDLAAQLHRRGHLDRLITSYPKFKAAQWGLPPGRIASILSHEVLNRAVHWLFGGGLRTLSVQQRLMDRYDRLAARAIPQGTGVFVGWSGMSLRSLRRAKSLGAVTVVERGSTHIQFQKRILDEERDRWSAGMDSVHPRSVDRELEEYAEADFIAIPSSFVRRTFLDAGVPPAKLIQVPYGVDLSQFRPAPKADNVFRVIFCGGLTLRKGVHYLLRAFAELDLPRAELWLVGPVRPEIEPFLSRYAGANTVVMGAIAQSELHRSYSQGSVFVLPSIEEGLAMVIPQAMACGLPVICTKNTGGEDIVRDRVDGLVIPARDVDALKAAIQFLFDSPAACRGMGSEALGRVKSAYTWDHYGEAIIAEYARISERTQQRLCPTH